MDLSFCGNFYGIFSNVTSNLSFRVTPHRRDLKGIKKGRTKGVPRIPVPSKFFTVHDSIKERGKRDGRRISRAWCAQFSGGRGRRSRWLASFISSDVYIPLTCTSGTQPWLTTDWKFISSLSALLLLRVSFSLLPFSLPLLLFFLSALVIELLGARIGLESGA